MESGHSQDAVVQECTTMYWLFAWKDQPLLVWWDTLLVLQLGLSIVNGVRGPHIPCDGLASE